QPQLGGVPDVRCPAPRFRRYAAGCAQPGVEHPGRAPVVEREARLPRLAVLRGRVGAVDAVGRAQPDLRTVGPVIASNEISRGSTPIVARSYRPIRMGGGWPCR